MFSFQRAASHRTRSGPEHRWPAGVVAVWPPPWPSPRGIAWLAPAVWALMFQPPGGRPLTGPTGDLTGLSAIGDDPLGRPRGFTRHLRAHLTHVKASLWTVRWTDRGGATWAAALGIAAGTSGSAAIGVTIRTMADENRTRRAVPFLALAPTAIWVATSMDTLFPGAAAWRMALIPQATIRGRGAGPRPPWGTIPLSILAAWGYGRQEVPQSVDNSSAEARDVRRARARAARWARCRHRPIFPRRPAHSAPSRGRRHPCPRRRPGRCGAGVVTALRTGDVGPTPSGGAITTARRVRDALSVHTGTVATAFAGDLPGITRGQVKRIRLPYAAWMTATAAVRRPQARRLHRAQAVTAPLIQALVRSPW